MSLKSLGGRPRDLHCCTPSALAKSSIADGEIRQILEEVGGCVTVAASTGVVAVYSVNSLEAHKSVEESQIVSTSIRVEPRLISVVSWNTEMSG